MVDGPESGRSLLLHNYLDAKRPPLSVFLEIKKYGK
jgi:hypothetical protein